MKTYKIPTFKKTAVKRNIAKEGERLETKIERMVHNKEPIKDTSPLMYTQRSEGVRAGTNIRTDRFEVAIEASTKIAKSFQARREEKHKPEEIGEPKPIQGKPAIEPGTQQSSA